MRAARLFSLLVFAVLLAYGVVGFHFLPQASFQGDLTRVGVLPESLFGWRKPQPAVPADLLVQSPMGEADVLVVGDSFSDGLVWQTVLVGSGFKVRTLSWDTVRGVCDDTLERLRALGFNGRYVVLEVIERNLQSTLDRSLACHEATFHMGPRDDARRGPPQVRSDPDNLPSSGRLSIGIKTALNAARYLTAARQPGFGMLQASSDVTVARVKDGCQLFSHTACQDTLYFTSEASADADPQAVQKITSLNARLSGIVPVWAVVPNKSTIYLHPEEVFWKQAAQQFHSVDLLRAGRQAIAERVIDLYPANNTHYSTSGYLMMGREILNVLRENGFGEKAVGGK